MKKFKRVVAISMALAMVLGCTAFAKSEEGTQVMDADISTATDGQNVTEEALTGLAATANVSADAEERDKQIATAAQDVISGDVITYNSAPELSRLVMLGYNSYQQDGPISLTKATLNYNNWLGQTKDVYVVCLSGTDTSAANQTTGWWTDLLSGFEFDNKYVKNIKKVISENIPAGSNLIVTGHSLGGMVAQQIASDSTIKKNYNVLNTITFGSPLINGFKREGTVKRLGDTSDVVPYLSVSTFLNIFWQTLGLNREDGGYTVLDFNFHAHNESYNRTDVWGAYDVTGTKNGSKTLTLDFATTQFFHSPVIVTE
ncbi:MAG: hypothetical protein K5644_05985 [Lachnospiraceae bacterium]|nr:hypothetical protein [Lachnospiraceae bacterium]